MSSDDLYENPDVTQFYDTLNSWHRPLGRVDFDYCAALAKGAASVLDLGCGTGELAVELGKNRSVTGVDPAAAMLDIGRQRPGGDHVTWCHADARTVRLDRRFDLVVLTGHAFQVFLTREDQRAALLTIAAHLKPDGVFVFDSRNIALRGPKTQRREDSSHLIDDPELGEIEAWCDSAYDPDMRILSYTNSFLVQKTGKVHSASAKIAYTPREELADLLAEAGLAVDTWFGDWLGTPYDPEAKDMIPVGRLV
ncbi:MAG: class I SAM-dependent methyltransferase [Alphaproteobacteria bacterium]